jgi:hypothetical protein
LCEASRHNNDPTPNPPQPAAGFARFRQMLN